MAMHYNKEIGVDRSTTKLTDGATCFIHRSAGDGYWIDPIPNKGGEELPAAPPSRSYTSNVI